MKANLSSNNNYDVRGFTLVELLAVIVVLAIIMLIAVNAVLPKMEEARQNAFAIEANGLIKAAQQYVITKSLTEGKVVTSTGVCVTVQQLVDNADSDLDKTKYSGYAVVKTLNDTSNIMLYEVYLANGSYRVDGKGITGTGDSRANVSINSKDVVKSAEKFGATCPTTYTTW